MNTSNPIKLCYRASLQIASRVKKILQTNKSSYKKHHAQFLESDAFLKHKRGFEQFEKENKFNHPENNIGALLQKYPKVRKTAVDIGCGGGWMSAKLSNRFQNIIGIEPSNAALEIAAQLFAKTKYPNISWHLGFAEEELAKLDLKEPTLFVTGCVLSHLKDSATAKICAAIEEVAPKGSILSFSECWGEESHDFMWHVRTKEWWQSVLPSWKFDFHGPQIQGKTNRNKGFHGIKIK